MSKKRNAGSKAPNPSGAFKPGPTKTEKREKHKKAAQAYYRRNIEDIWEKNCFSLRERSVHAGVVVELPPRPKSVSGTLQGREDSRGSPPFDISLVSDKLLNGPLHFNDYRGAPSSDEDSAFRRMDARRRVATESSEVNVAPQTVHTTSEERVAIEVLATMGGCYIHARITRTKVRVQVNNSVPRFTPEFSEYRGSQRIHASMLRTCFGPRSELTNHSG
ncbi:hypothetical protein C8F04DRAFT_1197734 [Mycena alexandri]|uniref:Uncharacterized protein n=1 Tax=Mycena alexandri TaxID=1745969 RepID=A0AAD6WNP1_9AGAR|nr:hypothetical protein C8F04DRAFT_1197734 [Mycena alexandri]